MPRSAPGRAPTILALAFLAAAAWHLALRAHGFSIPLMSDEGEYAYQARVWAEGGLPYRDAFCQKPPMVFLLYRAAFAAWPEDLLGPRRLAVLASLATMLVLLLAAPREWSLSARAAAPAFYGVMSTAPIGSLGFPANTEVFLCLFAALAAWALGGRGPRAAALCGLACGAALMTKQTALWTALAFVGTAAWRAPRGGRARVLLAWLAGAGAVPALFAAYFAARGGLSFLLEDAYRGNLRYASMVFLTSSAAGQARWFLGAILPALLLAHAPIYAGLLWGLSGARARRDAPETLAVLWLGAALAGAIAGFLLFPYYFLQAFPPAALLAAAGVEKLARLRGARAAGLAVAVASFYPAVIHARPYFRDRGEALARGLLFPNPLFEAVALGRRIGERSGPEDTIYVFGSEPQIYIYAGRRCATRHDFVYPLTLFGRDSAVVDRELSELSRGLPRFIVYSAQPASSLVATALGRRFQRGVEALLAERYRLDGIVDIRPEGSELRWSKPGKEPEADFSPRDSLLLFERRALPSSAASATIAR